MLSLKNQDILAPVENDSHSGIMKSWFSIMLVVSVEEVLLNLIGIKVLKSVTCQVEVENDLEQLL